MEHGSPTPRDRIVVRWRKLLVHHIGWIKAHSSTSAYWGTQWLLLLLLLLHQLWV
jgi:hypothetical protein